MKIYVIDERDPNNNSFLIKMKQPIFGKIPYSPLELNGLFGRGFTAVFTILMKLS